jgi:hypothetical protein
MKKQILILVILMFFINGFSQSYWFKIFESPFYQSPFGNILIIGDHYYFPCVEQYEYGNYAENYSFISKVSSNGEIINSQLIRNDFSNMLGTIEQLDDGNLLSIGHIDLTSNETFSLFQVEFDENLNILQQKVDTGGTRYGFIMNSFKNSKGNFYFHMTTGVDPFPFLPTSSYLAEIKQDKTLVKDTIFETVIYDIAPVFNNNENILVESRGLDTSSGISFTQLNLLDTNFNLDETPLSFESDSMGYYFSIHNGVDSNYYFSAMRYSGEGSWISSFACSKVSSEFQKLSYQAFDSTGYWFFTTDFNGIDTYETYVYAGGNFEYKGMNYPLPNYFFLIKMDTSLSVISQHFYGGDKNYMLNSIKTTTEGDVLLLGRCSELDTDLWNIFIMKVDENGLITSTKEEPEIPIKNAIVTPNPGKDYLQLHTRIYPAQLQIFNINGQLVLEEVIQKNVTTIQTQSLSSGTYVWQLLKDGKIVETDKWVKE